MPTSLIARLATLVAGIIIVATMTLAVIMHRATSSEFVSVLREELPQTINPGRRDAVAHILEEEYAEEGVAGLRSIAAQGLALPEEDSVPFIVIGPDLTVLATTEAPFISADVQRLADGTLRMVVDQHTGDDHLDIELTAVSPQRLVGADGVPFGELIVLPEEIEEKRGSSFAISVWREAGPWLFAVLAMAVLLAVWTLRRALQPIEALTRAAGALKEGTYPEALELRGGGAEFDKLIETFNSATRTLAETDQIRRQLISDLAHELRTPVTNIKGQLEALQAGLITPDDEFRETLGGETRLLERLVEDFQQIAISDAGQLHLALQPIPLNETVENIIGPMAHQSGASLDNRIGDGFAIMADEERFRQILCNLFENARREVPAGLEVSITAHRAGDKVVLRFEDNGSGIAKPDQPYIFERFYRAEKSRNRATGGAGLGLPIVKGLVTAMGGDIRYETGAAGGAAFLIELPSADKDGTG